MTRRDGIECPVCKLWLGLDEYKQGMCDECIVEQINKDLREAENGSDQGFKAVFKLRDSNEGREAKQA